MNVMSAQHKLTYRLGQLETLEKQVADFNRNHERGLKWLEFYAQAQSALAEVVRDTQAEFLGTLSELVTSCLQSVFEKDIMFHVELVEQSGKMLVDMWLERDGKRQDPMTANGGGVVDVIAFALRVSCLLLVRHRVDPVILLDEPFRFVSKDLQGRIGQMIVDLSERLGVQFVIVTHESELVEALSEDAMIVEV